MTSISTASLNLNNLSILRQAFNAPGKASTLLRQLPQELQDRIPALLLATPFALTSQEGLSLAIRDIAIDILGAQREGDKNRIYGIFYTVCGARNTEDPKWAEHHISDDNRIDQLLQSLEMAETINTLDVWSAENPNRREAADRILEFIKNKYATKLDLSYKRLDTLPDVFMNSELQNRLINLDLFHNQLQSLPESMGNLVSLQSLILHSNRLQSLPESMGNLVSLQSLILYSNRLQSLPDWIGNLVKLQELDLTANQLQSLPESIGNLSNLQQLDLTNNQLQSLPESMGNIENLKFLHLISNQLQSLPEYIGNLENLHVLNLEHNRLRSLPESMGNLENLWLLKLACNQLQSLPESIGLLSNLRSLSLERNVLRDLPNAITGLNSACEIHLEGAGLSMDVLTRLRQMCNAPVYDGPTFNFSIQENSHNLQGYSSIQDAFSSICQKAGIVGARNFEQSYPNLQRYMSDNSKGPALHSWLSRLSYMKDTQRAAEVGLFRVILSHLDLAEKDEEFRHSFFTIIDGAAATCGDRMALSVLHLGILNRSLTLDKTNLKTFADFLIHGPWMLGQLEDAAREKVKTLHFVDEIEVYLAYPVKLKERLGLQIDVGDMLYFGCSGVTQDDLENAARGIEGVLQETDAVANILVQRQDWIEALEKHEAKAEAMEAFKQKRSARHTEMAEARDLNENDYSELQRDYEADIISLTKEILRSPR